MPANYRTISLTTLLWLATLGALVMAAPPRVAFDVTPLVRAVPQPANRSEAHLPDRKIVETQIELSTRLDSRIAGASEELIVQVQSLQPGILVSDFSPRTAMASDVSGSISVSENHDFYRHAAVRGTAGYPGIGWGTGDANREESQKQVREYQAEPPRELIVASGTIGRGSGVYFKIRKSDRTTLEGSRPLVVCWEVPLGWRGGLIEVSACVLGTKDSKAAPQPMKHFLVSAFLDGDEVAAKVAEGHAIGEQRLRSIANTYSKQIRHANQPTPIHTIGLALDVLQPTIPENWLEEVLFGSSRQYPTGAQAHLPVDVRVAILDYLDHKEAMETLASVSMSIAKR